METFLSPCLKFKNLFSSKIHVESFLFEPVSTFLEALLSHCGSTDAVALVTPQHICSSDFLFLGELGTSENSWVKSNSAVHQYPKSLYCRTLEPRCLFHVLLGTVSPGSHK